VPTTRVIPLQNQLKDNFGQTLGVSLNWNIFNGMAVQNNIKRSQINMQMQENNLQQNKLVLRASVARSVADYKASVAKVNAAQKALNASVLQMDFTEKRFENGLINYVEYVNVKNQFTRAQITALQARFEWLFNTVVVDFYNGNPLTIPQS
jgi:outer membrane protein